MAPPRMSDEERVAWGKAHMTQVDSALARLDAADAALVDDDDAPAAEAVHLDQTQCSFVFFRRSGSAATAYDIWRCANAHEADAIAAQRSHARYAMRSDTMLAISRAAVRQQAQLLAATARKKGKVGAPGGGEGSGADAGEARSSPTRSRERDEAFDGGAGDDDDAFASPQRKKQKNAAKGPALTTPAEGGLFTPAPAEAPAPASAPHLAALAAHTAAPPPAAARAAPPPRSDDAQRVEALEEQLQKAQRALARMARRVEALERAHEARRAAFDALRADLGSALGAAAACVTSAAPGAAPGAA